MTKLIDVKAAAVISRYLGVHPLSKWDIEDLEELLRLVQYALQDHEKEEPNGNR